MSHPILAKVGRALGLRRRGPANEASATPATVSDFLGGGFFAQRRISPAEARMTLEQATQGSLSAQYELFSMMEDTWPRLAKNLGELRHAAARAAYTTAPFAERGKQPTATASQRAEYVDQCLRQWWPKPGTLELSFENTLFHALDAYGKGISVLETHWQRTAKGVRPRASHVVHNKRWGWNASGTELGLVGESGFPWQPFPEHHFLVGMWQARTGAPGATAVLRPLVPYWAGVTFGWEWLLSNAQIFGVPFRWATFDANRKELGPILRDMLAAMGACGYAAFPEGTKLEFKEAVTSATGNPQVVIQELADKACDLLILGQELSGGAQKAGLGGGAAGLQSDVRKDRLENAAQWCADLLNYQLVPAILMANWGDTEEPPTIVADVDAEPDPKALAERDNLLLSAGVELPKAWFYERHAIPMPVAGEEVIAKKAEADPAAADASDKTKAARKKPAGDAVAAKQSSAEAAQGQLFRISAIEQLSEAKRREFAPLLVRIAALAEAATPADYEAALVRLAADLPALRAQVVGSGRDDVAAAWTEVLAPFAAEGVADLPTVSRS